MPSIEISPKIELEVTIAVVTTMLKNVEITVLFVPSQVLTS